ncbi:MAG: hypothetical protein KKH73_02085, partial [Actinobacteria bacterium]|nr:hypothetical protein [Actinomycetota bacterium]
LMERHDNLEMEAETMLSGAKEQGDAMLKAAREEREKVTIRNWSAHDAHSLGANTAFLEQDAESLGPPSFACKAWGRCV